MNSASLSILATNGIHGHDAEAALRRVFAVLAAPSADSVRVLEELNISPDDVDTSLVRCVRIIRRLADAGLDPSQACHLFGNQGAQAILILIDNIERIEELEAS